MSLYGRHFTCMQVACCSMSDGLSLDAIFCVVKRRLMKITAEQVSGEDVVAGIG